METVLAASTFEPFGTSHLVMLAIFFAGILPLVRFGRLHRGADSGLRFGRMIAIAIPLATLPLQVIDFMPGEYSFQTTLPIQLCDLAWIAATYALWTHRRYAVALTYYWGLILTTQGLATPALEAGFPTPKFIAFWGMHILIVWAAIYLTWGLGIRPTWRGYATTALTTLVWAGSAFTFNAITGTNYGFLNRKPSTPSILDLLGPWPLYVVFEIAIVLSVWALITWPWTRTTAHRSAAVGNPPVIG